MKLLWRLLFRGKGSSLTAQGLGLFAGQAFWSAAAALGSSGANVLVLFIVARQLGAHSSGAFVLFQTTIIAISSFVIWGLATATTRGIAMAEHKAANEARLLKAGELLAACATGIALVVLILATTARGSVLPMAGSPIIFWSATAALIGAVFDGVYKAHLTGQGRMRLVAVISLVGSAVTLGLLVLTVAKTGVAGATMAVGAGWIVQALLGSFSAKLTRSIRRERARLDWRQVRSLVTIAVPATLAGAMVAPSHWLVQATLATSPEGYIKVALLGICLQWFNAVTLVPTSVGKVAMPLVARHLQNRNGQGAGRFLTYSLLLNGGITIPLAAAVAWVSPWLLGLYSPQMTDQSGAMVVAMVAAAIAAFQVPFANIIWARSKAWLAVAINVLWAICFVTGALALKSQGTTGALLSLGFAYLVTLTVLALMMRRTF